MYTLKEKSKYTEEIEQIVNKYKIMPTKTLSILATFVLEIIWIVKKIKPMYKQNDYEKMLKEAEKMLGIK